MIDIVTTSTLRPDILDRTYRSFCKKLFNNDRNCRLIINIDPVGDKTVNPDEVLSVARRYFNDVVFNIPDSANFASAVIWCWSNVKNDYVFHLEDDWELLRNIDINDMIKVIDRYDSICSLRLSQGRIKGKFLDNNILGKGDNLGFLLFDRISLNPTLIKKKFINEVIGEMVDYLNPESQLVPSWANKKRQDVVISEIMGHWHHVQYNTVKGALVRDIGREWRVRRKIKRQPCFINWG